ncbi:transglutaminaseTgpA domain-containing protein [Streptomyces sp. NPDC058221]|uniref:transglutaminase TgpA family protein n=1 Tax=Streptomyces sp. NPDC058221 TaxID=3346388 RepID=UPI0036EA6F8B
MSGRGRLALCAFAATLMAACSMLPLVDPVSWMLQAAFLLAIQYGVGMLCRRVPLPRMLTVAVQVVVMLVLLTVAFAREQALAGFLPGPQSVQQLADLLTAGGDDVGRYAIPAPASEGIRLMLVGGVLLVGLAVDVLAVTFRSAAPAGLPLLALYSVAAGLSDGGADWLWFVLAGCGYLLLLLAEGRDRLSQWGRVFAGAARSSRGGPGGGDLSGGGALAPVRTGRRIGALALGVALVVPAALPALDGGLLAGPGSGNGKGGGGGTISAVNPLVSLQNNLNQPENRQVMSYRTNSNSPQDFYLRILALDQFNGNEWRASTRHLKDVPKRLPSPEGLAPDVAVTEINSNISASASYRQTYLPLPYPATEVRVGGHWRYEPQGRTLVGDDGETTRGAQYQVSSLVVQPTSGQLADAGPVPPAIQREYTQVPDSLPKVVKETADEVTRGADNAYEQAVKLQDYFASEGGFTYDTSVNSGTGSAAIGRFLKDKQGFCVHFSFTMAAMARTLGIPARVAVGFTPGTAQADGSMSVGLRDAHAWPELYFEGVGWTRFEPTPTRGSAPSYTVPDTPSGDTADPARPEASASAATPVAPSASESCPPQMRKQGECGSTVAPGAVGPTDSGRPTGRLAGVALLVVLVLLLPSLPMFWRIRARARRLGFSAGRTPGDATTKTLAAWREITDTGWDHGIAPDESLTPRKAAARVVRLGQLDTDGAAAVHRVAGAVEQVLYAPEPQPAAGLSQDVRTARAALRASAGRFTRLRAVVAPRSAVRVVWAVSERRSALAARWTMPQRPTWLRLPSRQN